MLVVKMVKSINGVVVNTGKNHQGKLRGGESMTRTEFINDIQCWDDLMDFCSGYDCNVCEDIIPYISLNRNLGEDFTMYGDEYDWDDIRDWLNNIDENANYYYRSGSFEYESVDNQFESYKDDVLEWGDEGDVWDPEDEDEDFDDDGPFYIGDADRALLAELGLDDTEDESKADEDFVSSSDDELEEGCTAEELLGFLMNHFQYTVTE